VKFLDVIGEVCARFDSLGVGYALVGGFGMAMRGVQRATVDLDFIVLLDDLEAADKVLLSSGYKRSFHSENVSHYRSEDADFGRIDLIHAFRGPSLSMLGRAERIEVAGGVSLLVARSEDIVGLKIQAAFNDPDRSEQDWQDIRLLVQAAGQRGEAIDWELIADYLAIFEQSERIDEIRNWYGEAD